MATNKIVITSEIPVSILGSDVGCTVVPTDTFMYAFGASSPAVSDFARLELTFNPSMSYGGEYGMMWVKKVDVTSPDFSLFVFTA